jgi:hypothetical protein
MNTIFSMIDRDLLAGTTGGVFNGRIQTGPVIKDMFPRGPDGKPCEQDAAKISAYVNGNGLPDNFCK